MEELKDYFDHAKEYKLCKSVYKKIKECKDIDELKDDKWNYHISLILWNFKI